MRDTIECLLEIEEDGTYLRTIFKVLEPGVGGVQEARNCGFFLLKPPLTVSQGMLQRKMIAFYQMEMAFKDLAQDGEQRDRSIVSSGARFGLFRNGNH